MNAILLIEDDLPLGTALARALRAAVEIDPRKGDAIPSTKGVL